MKRYEDIKGSNSTFYNIFSYVSVDEYNNIMKPKFKGQDILLRGTYFCLYSFLDYSNKPTKMKQTKLEAYLGEKTVFDRMLE